MIFSGGSRLIRRGAAGILILAWLAGVAVLTVVQSVWSSGLIGDLAYLTATISIVVVSWAAVRVSHGPARLVGALIATSLTIITVGDLTSVAISWWLGMEPVTSSADPIWLINYGFLWAALLLLLRGDERIQGRGIDGLIDIAAVLVAGTVVIWELAVAATASDASLPVWVRVVWGTYPVLDFATIVLALRLLFRDRTVAALSIVCGAGLWLVADITYLEIADPEGYNLALDALWLWGAVLVALAVVVGFERRLRWRWRDRLADRAGTGRVLTTLLPLTALGVLELYLLMRGHDRTRLVVAVGTLVLIGIAFLRMMRLARMVRTAFQDLASQKRYASALAANSSDAVVVVDENLRLVDDFPSRESVTGRPNPHRGQRLLDMVVPEDRQEARATLQRCLERPGELFSAEVRTRSRRGRLEWLAARVVNLLDNPDVQGIVINLHNVSDRKRAEAELSHQALHDPLTGLANRELFRDRLSHALNRRSGSDKGPAVVFLDLDGFKTVNDSLGHDVGDELLRRVASRLTASVRRGDTVGRLGGDEFGVLIEQSDSPFADATAAADRILLALREPVQLGKHRVTVSASIGIATADGSDDPTALLRDADLAMYRSKATGKGRWTRYRPDMRTGAIERLQLESALWSALDAEQFQLVYQPVMELRTDRVVGFEALLRWRHPEQGLLPPDRFVPVAEEIGLIGPLGQWVLDQATRAAAGWQQAYGTDAIPAIAVNLSTRQFTPELVDQITGALAAAGLAPGSLVLEITETALMRDTTVAADSLRELRQIGVRVAVDDFGTGYSSLNFLRRFPVDVLKIDQSFIRSIPEHGEFPPIVRGMLEMGRGLRVYTLAEGVETEFQRARLRAEGCDFAQGYLFARPMSADEAEHYLSAGRLATTG